MRASSSAILRQVEDLGYAVSVHDSPGRVELYAVHLSGDETPHVARCDGNGEEELCALAAMVVGVRQHG